MKLFAKFFLCATLILSIALLLSGYLFITFSFENALEREKERALNQFQYDKFTVQASLITSAELLADKIPYHLLSRLSSDLSGITAFFAEDQSLLYSDSPLITGFDFPDNIADGNHAYLFHTVDDYTYFMICGKVTQSGVTIYLLVATDVNGVIAGKGQMADSFLRVYFVTLSISMAVILVLSALITRPINKINKAAAGIAQGKYRERLSVSGNDEIGELSANFNLMADAVEDKIGELSETARKKEDFVANFAHELKTPMTSIIGYADMLYQKTLTAEQVKDAAGYILDEGLRLEALSLKLMDLIILNKQDFLLEEIQTEVLFSNIMKSLEPVLSEKNMSFHLEADRAYVSVEYDLFKTMLLNLIDNAMKADGSKIEITGKPVNGRYHISVSDDGMGIPEPEMNRITEAFYMVDKSRSRKQHSAGLGLALAAKVAEIHCGSLKIESVEGAGTVISFDIPMLP